MAEGKFRQDLYYRINVMRIVSPSLADHAEDIPQIATHYLKHYSQLFQKPMQAIEPEAMAMLQNYPWPGNVRELENTIQRAIILAPGVTIRAEDLPLNMHADKIIDISEYNPEGSFERQLARLQDQARHRCGAREQRQQDAGRAQSGHLARLSASPDPARRARLSLRAG